MVVETSVLVAVILREPDYEAFVFEIAEADDAVFLLPTI